MAETTKIYNSDSITVLEGLEAIRYRPDMYIGSPSGNPSDGLYRLCREIIDNSVDEYLANCNDSICILYDSKTMITTVIDNGRGIPVGWNEKAKMDSLTAVVTKIHAGGKFNHETYKTSSGKNGVGASAVNALSDMMQVWSNNSTDRKWYTQKFERGVAKSEVEKVKLPEEYKAYIKKTGTIITWLPDKTIFTDSIKLNLSRLKRELHDIQYLCPKLRIKLIIDGNEAEYYSEKGLSELVSRSSSDGMFTFTNEWMDVAVNFTKDDGYEFKSYVNVCYTNLGGTHLDGLKKALCNTLKTYSKNKILNEDLMEGVVGAIHCKVAEPQYQGQTKNELTNSEVEGLVVDALNEPLNKFFKKNKALTERIIKYAEEMLEKKQKMKADKALLKGISQLNTGAKFISDKFLDADRRKYKNPKDLELFIVEGDSAGGHFNKAREPYQASLRIRGKIINAAKADPADLFGSKTEKNEGNKEIKSIVAALGCGIQDDYDESKLRFGKVILTCFAGDTKVKMLDGTEKSFEELVKYEEEHPDTEYWVYSIDENGNLVPGKAMHPHITRYVNELIEITLDNGASFKCTPDHMLMLRDGTYKAAKDITTDDSLMPLYTKFCDNQFHNPGREMYYDINTNTWKFTHKTISECINGKAENGIHVHHVDGNHLNNEPSNLQLMSSHDHLSLHAVEGMIKYNKSQEHRDRISYLWHNTDTYAHTTFNANGYNGSEEQKAMLKEKHASGAYSYDAFKAYNESIEAKNFHRKQMINMNKDENLNRIRLESKYINIGMILVTNGFKLTEELLEEKNTIRKHIGICPNTEELINLFGSVENYINAVYDKLNGLAAEALEKIKNTKYNVTATVDKRISSNVYTKKNGMAKIGKTVLERGLELNEKNYMTVRKDLGSIRVPKYENLTNYFTDEAEFIEYCKNYNHKIVSKKVIKYDEDIPVYDFTVETYHNFVVGGNVNIFARQCDADPDGEHISNLLLSFFIQYMPDLIKNGHVYTIDAPLFIGNSSKGKKFGMTRVEVDNQMKAENIKDYDVLRLKGWGECTPEQLSELCLDKKTRKLKQIKWTDNTEDMLEKTMGNGSTYRKQLLGVID